MARREPRLPSHLGRHDRRRRDREASCPGGTVPEVTGVGGKEAGTMSGGSTGSRKRMGRSKASPKENEWEETWRPPVWSGQERDSESRGGAGEDGPAYKGSPAAREEERGCEEDGREEREEEPDFRTQAALPNQGRSHEDRTEGSSRYPSEEDLQWAPTLRARSQSVVLAGVHPDDASARAKSAVHWEQAPGSHKRPGVIHAEWRTQRCERETNDRSQERHADISTNLEEKTRGRAMESKKGRGHVDETEYPARRPRTQNPRRGPPPTTLVEDPGALGVLKELE